MKRKKTEPAARPVPDPQNYPLLPPDMNYVYFEGADDYPFDPERREYSPANAWYLAEAAFLAYTHPGFARMAAVPAGFTEFRFFGGRTTECFAAWNKKYAVIAFRGTELRSTSAAAEILTDLNAFPVDFSGGGRVHKGFLNALDEVWGGEDGLEALLTELLAERPGRPLWLTGHSLGGALATLAFARIKKAAGLYIYGSPRTGNSEFAAFFEGKPVFRVENAGDPIIRIPLESGNEKESFTHIGTPVYISEEGNVSFDRPEQGFKYHKAAVRKTLRGHIKKSLTLAGRTVKKLCPGGTKDSQPVSAKDISKGLLGEWSSHFSLAAEDWSGYFKSLEKMTKLSLDRHAPVYYAVHLWNAMLKQSENRSD